MFYLKNDMERRHHPAERKITVDRFIPKRSCIQGSEWKLSKFEKEFVFSNQVIDRNGEQYLNRAKYLEKTIAYKTKIWESLFPGDKAFSANNRVLDFSTPKTGSENVRRKTKIGSKKFQTMCTAWQVHPRHKPLLSKPETILDLPDIDITTYNHLIDWGKNGQIATIIQGEVHMWASKESATTHTNTNQMVESWVKWNTKGTLFAVGRKGGFVSIIDANTLKVVYSVRCKCFICSITAIAWTREDSLIFGCSMRYIALVRGPSADPEFIRGTSQVINIELSCNGAYTAISLLNGNLSIFGSSLFPFKQLLWEDSDFSIKICSFHPWQESLFAVGCTDHIAIYNLQHQNPRVPSALMKIPEYCVLDCLTFNPRSAELLCSFYHEDLETGLNATHLTVFCSADEVTDDMQVLSSRIPLVIWDGTGTKLATVSGDENLAIWDFFGTKTTLEKKYLNENRDPPTLNMFETVKKFGSIR